MSKPRMFALLQTTLDVCVTNLYVTLFRNQLLSEPWMQKWRTVREDYWRIQLQMI